MSNLEKENAFKNTKNFTPYGTNPEKDKMVKSNNWEDRLKIAKEGYGLDILINDEDWEVREAVAYQGYGLDVLINDKEEWIRRVVAKQGYGLDVLINDEDYRVRKTVAGQGYGLDILINDEEWGVIQNVLSYLWDNNLTLAKWCSQNNKEINLKKLAFSLYPAVRAEAVESGYIYKENEIYIDSNCNFTPYGTDFEKDKMVKSNLRERLKMAEQGYGLDVLINDENWRVRRTVAEQGYGLDILINDKSWPIREAVAKQGYGLEVLINDEKEDVRKSVFKYLKNDHITLKEWAEKRK